MSGWYITKRGEGPDMDSTDCYPLTEVLENDITISWVVSFKSRCFVTV